MRVIAGSAKGRKIETIDGIDTRPTLDRVKEAMFGSLQFEVPEAGVLDLFSGSGALALEAASRGASYVVANDINSICVRVIKRNVENIGFQKIITVKNMDYRLLIERLESERKNFKIAFIDAPYAQECGPDALEMLSNSDIISVGGYIVYEHARERTVTESAGLFKLLKTKFFGSCAFSVYQRC